MGHNRRVSYHRYGQLSVRSPLDDSGRKNIYPVDVSHYVSAYIESDPAKGVSFRESRQVSHIGRQVQWSASEKCCPASCSHPLSSEAPAFVPAAGNGSTSLKRGEPRSVWGRKCMREQGHVRADPGNPPGRFSRRARCAPRPRVCAQLRAASMEARQHCEAISAEVAELPSNPHNAVAAGALSLTSNPGSDPKCSRSV